MTGTAPEAVPPDEIGAPRGRILEKLPEVPKAFLVKSAVSPSFW